MQSFFRHFLVIEFFNSHRRSRKLAPFIRPNLPDTGDLIRQHGVQDQALAMKK
jgi:hypothetical protein